MITAESIVELCRNRGIELQAVGDRLRFRGASLDDEIRGMLRMHKMELLALLAPKPVGSDWREDRHGRLWFSDGTVYAPLADGTGWILLGKRGHRMIEPGLVGEHLPEAAP